MCNCTGLVSTRLVTTGLVEPLRNEDFLDGKTTPDFSNLIHTKTIKPTKRGLTVETGNHKKLFP